MNEFGEEKLDFLTRRRKIGKKGITRKINRQSKKLKKKKKLKKCML